MWSAQCLRMSYVCMAGGLHINFGHKQTRKPIIIFQNCAHTCSLISDLFSPRSEAFPFVHKPTSVLLLLLLLPAACYHHCVCVCTLVVYVCVSSMREGFRVCVCVCYVRAVLCAPVHTNRMDLSISSHWKVSFSIKTTQAKHWLKVCYCKWSEIPNFNHRKMYLKHIPNIWTYRRR